MRSLAILPTTICIVLKLSCLNGFDTTLVMPTTPTLPEVVAQADAVVFGRAFEQPDGTCKVSVSENLLGQSEQELSFIPDRPPVLGGPSQKVQKDLFASRLPPEKLYCLKEVHRLKERAATWIEISAVPSEEDRAKLEEAKVDVLGEAAAKESSANIHRLVAMRLTPSRYLHDPSEADTSDFMLVLATLFRNKETSTVDGITRQVAVAHLKRSLLSSNKWNVLCAIHALSISGSQEAAAVTPLLQNADPTIRERAVLYLDWCAAP